MPIPWLTALKVIPWGDVIEHAPKVLAAARKLMDRQATAAPSMATAASPSPADTLPTAEEAVTRLGLQLQALRQDSERWQENQIQLTRTVAELAEQNARLVTAVETLRVRTRLLLVTAAVLAAGLTWALWR